MSLIDRVRQRLANGDRPEAVRADLVTAGVSVQVLEVLAQQVPELVPAAAAAPATPYARALELKGRGLSDAEIVTALESQGLSAEDAQFVLRSLPGGALGDATKGPSDSPLAEAVVDGGVTLLDQFAPLGVLYDGFKALK